LQLVGVGAQAARVLLGLLELGGLSPPLALLFFRGRAGRLLRRWMSFRRADASAEQGVESAGLQLVLEGTFPERIRIGRCRRLGGVLHAPLELGRHARTDL